MAKKHALLLHFSLFGLTVIPAIALALKYPSQASATVLDSCRTLLALNGTLLALVVGFSAFYFAVIDARRMEAARPADKNSDSSVQILKELSRASVPLYREKMNETSTLLIAIASSYGFFSSCILYGLSVRPFRHWKYYWSCSLWVHCVGSFAICNRGRCDNNDLVPHKRCSRKDKTTTIKRYRTSQKGNLKPNCNKKMTKRRHEARSLPSIPMFHFFIYRPFHLRLHLLCPPNQLFPFIAL